MSGWLEGMSEGRGMVGYTSDKVTKRQEECAMCLALNASKFDSSKRSGFHRLSVFIGWVLLLLDASATGDKRRGKHNRQEKWPWTILDAK